MSENLSVLQGNEQSKQAGSFVLAGQEVAKQQGFRNVSKIWYDKTMSFEDGLNSIDAGRAVTEDMNCTLAEMRPSFINGEFKMKFIDGRVFTPTVHAMNQMGNWADCGTWYVNSLLSNPVDAKERELYQRDSGDAETLARVLANGFRRVDPNKKFLWRTRQDGTLRAMLTERFAIIDNRWYVELLAKLLPDARLSHWRGDSDTLYGNVLIPDTIRAESDSDYGGMLSVGNSEIGERRISSCPSIFRAICMNGMVWGATKGTAIAQVHRGKINLEMLAESIQTNLDKQIPLLPTGIDKLLGLQSMKFQMSAKPLFAAIAKQYKLTKKQASGTLEAYHVEPAFMGTLFGVANAITRSGQKLDNAEWLRFDGIGGLITSYTKQDFDNLVSVASTLKAKEVDEVFAA